MERNRKMRLVVIGGGTGTYVALSGLKGYAVDLTAIISVADSGGSTGRLRDEFGFLPVGDLRQALAALAQDEKQEWIKNLLLYRFSKGSGLEGHNLGNLLLTALQDMAGSTPKALEIAHEIFRLRGHIYPVTTQNIQLVIEYDDGTVEIGEKVLDEKHGGKKIAGIKTSPKCVLYKEAEKALLAADLIVIGPGDLYGSVLPNLIVDGIRETFAATKAKTVYVLNLMTRYTQTHNYSALDHVAQVEKAIGKKLDHIIVSSSKVPNDILKLYETYHEYPVCDNLDSAYGIIREDLLKPIVVDVDPHDTVPRSFLRHDQEKLAQHIMNLCTKGK